MENDRSKPVAKYHRVVFLREGRPTSLTFPGMVLAQRFLSTLHSNRKGRIEPVPEFDNVQLEPPAPDRPAGSILQCPRGPRVRTWLPRKPRVTRRFPDFSKNVMNIPRQSAGFSLTFPEQPADKVEVVGRFGSHEEAVEWTNHRYGKEADGEWWPKEEKKDGKAA